MSKLVFVVTGILMMASAGTASATECATPTTGMICAGTLCWIEYSPDVRTECWVKDPNLRPSTMSCFGSNAYDFLKYPSHFLTRTFTVADDGSDRWEVGVRVDFADPDHSWFYQINVRVAVSSPTTGTRSYFLFSHAGSSGNDLSCEFVGGEFTAHRGDTITVEIGGTSGLGLTRAGDVHLFRLY